MTAVGHLPSPLCPFFEGGAAGSVSCPELALWPGFPSASRGPDWPLQPPACRTPSLRGLRRWPEPSCSARLGSRGLSPASVLPLTPVALPTEGLCALREEGD